MNPRPRSLPLGLAGLVLTMVATGCGGSSSKVATPATSAPTAATSTTTASTTTSTTIDTAADAAVANGLVLQPGDFPAGWKSTPHVADPGDHATQKQFAACVGARDPDTDTATVDGPDFHMGDAEVTSSVSMAPSRAAFENDITALRSPKLGPCLENILRTALQTQLQKDAPGAVIGKIALAEIPVPTLGEVTVETRLTIQVSVSGRTIVVYDDNVSLGKGRAEVTVDFTNTGAPFESERKSALLAAAGAKLAAAA